MEWWEAPARLILTSAAEIAPLPAPACYESRPTRTMVGAAVSTYAFRLATKVSDFVYPAWCESFHKPLSTQFDYCGRITEPFQMESVRGRPPTWRDFQRQ